MERKHSGLGIASFIISIVAAVLIFIFFGVAGVMEATTPGGIDEESPVTALLGLFGLGLMLLDLVALGIGIGGLFQKDRQKLFAVLGIVFCMLTLLGTAALIIIGNSM